MNEPHWVEIAISRLLRTGVVLSITVVAIGLIVTFTHHPSYVSSRPDLRTLVNPQENFPHSLSVVEHGVESWSGQSIISLGLLLLIATPVARVAFSIVVFAIERDRLYVAITAIVLALLLLSFLLGAAE